LFAICGIAVNVQADSELEWKTFKEYAEQGDSGGKKIYIHFWAVWCQYCHKMETDTFGHPSVVAALNKDFYPIRVDTDKEPLVAGMFGVKGLPYNLFLTENGKILAHRPGYVPPATFLKILYSVNGIEVSQ
jgi:thioredoxin-related protein